MSPSPLGHRPELDGLRGAAVLAVVLFHAGLPVARGGWLGVDVFFVLSGFLITTLLLEEQQCFGRVSLSAFYARRALRLLPAVLALLAVLAVLVAADVLGRAYVDAAPWVLLYVANWERIVGEATPLQHLWSLSVEEQFYVLWPPLLLLLLRFVASWRGRAIVLGSLALGVLATRSVLYGAGVISAERAYFGTDLRADALLLGCLFAVHRHGGSSAPVARHARRLLWPALLGLGVVMVLPMTPLDGFGPLAFGPVDLAALVLVAVVVTSPDALPALRWSPLVRLGVLSYGVYLWHVPVMYVVGDGVIPRLVVGIPASLALAELSRRVVELPALRAKHRFDRKVPIGSGAAAAQLGGDGVDEGAGVGREGAGPRHDPERRPVTGLHDEGVPAPVVPR